MRVILVLAKITWLELVRDRSLALFGFLGLFFLALSALLGSLSLDEQFRMMVHLGSSSLHLLLVALALFWGGTLLQKEMDRQTCLVILSRPVTRSEFLSGKILGVSAVLSFFSLSGASLHYVLLGGEAPLIHFLALHVGLLLETLCVLVLAVFSSLFLRPLVGIAFSFSIWLASHWQQDLAFFAEKSHSDVWRFVSNVLRRTLPPFDLLDVRSVHFLMSGSLTQLLVPFSVCVVWFVLVLSATQVLWRRKDLV